jgi:phosphatidylglycerophosphate synthase
VLNVRIGPVAGSAAGAAVGPMAGPVAGLVAMVGLLAALTATVGLSGLGWVVGLTCAVVVNCATARGLAGSDSGSLGPADWVTLARAMLACGVAALVQDAFLRSSSATALVALAAAALLLDPVDGWVARRTRTESPFGARFDGEVDAFLILVLSVYVAHSFGVWVLAIGGARYLFALAGWGMPWQMPPRPWRKVVAGTQGVVLLLAAAEVMPRWLTYVALFAALALLAESFGRDLWWLWRVRGTELAEHRHQEHPEPAEQPEPDTGERPDSARTRRRVALAVAVDVLALLFVWLALVAPNQIAGVSAGGFLRIPVEALVVAALALVLPSGARRAMTVVAGVLLAVLTLVKVLDVGFFAVFDRPFNPVTDRSYLMPAITFVRTGMDPLAATVVFVASGVLVVALLVGLPLALARLTGLVARHRGLSLRILPALVVVWGAVAMAGLHLAPGAPIASTSASRLAVDEVQAVALGVRRERAFSAAAAADRFRDDAATGDLLDGLRGKDVLLTFVESYGRSAVEGLPTSSRIRAVLDSGTRRLRASGYTARSAFLTSPTFGGFSWLAHSTLQSGLWIDTEQRHDRLLESDRMTLNRAFRRAGWQTFAVQPSNRVSWPEGKAFYRFDEMFDRQDIRYQGPPFGWSVMPDQYALAAFQQQVLAQPDRPPVMAELDLTSSHPPWAPLPRMLDWSKLGDGSVYRAIHERAESSEELWRHPENVPAAYERSIAYSLNAVVSFVQKYGDDDLVVIMLGDHQPAAVVTGPGASRDVPITVIAHDPRVIDRISGWRWQDGMRPNPRAPVWPMDAFRDRFLEAFSAERPPVRAASALDDGGEQRRP